MRGIQQPFFGKYILKYSHLQKRKYIKYINFYKLHNSNTVQSHIYGGEGDINTHVYY